MTKVARLKPLDARKGHVIRRLTVFATTFDVTKGWYAVSDDVAAYLQQLHQVPGDEDSPLAFDVLAQADAEALELQERKRAEERAGAAAPHVVAPRDPMIPPSSAVAPPDANVPGRRPRTPQAAGKRP